MVERSARLKRDIVNFQERVLTDAVGVLDPEDIHHEFARGGHGRKLDFDKIETNSDFYIEWVSLYARAIKATYPHRLPDALVGIAWGANRLSKSVANLLGVQTVGLTTVKLNANSVELNEEALQTVAEQNIRFGVTIEDVGTTGGTSATAIEHLRAVGVRRIEAWNGWQRNPILPMLDKLRVPQHAMILHPLPTYSPEECRETGYCADGIELIERPKEIATLSTQ